MEHEHSLGNIDVLLGSVIDIDDIQNSTMVIEATDSTEEMIVPTLTTISDIYLLDDTIINNIAFGLNTKDINQEAVLRSIKLSRLEDYVNSLEKKDNTIIGNRGIKVSGGQKQRLPLWKDHNPHADFCLDK